MIATRRLGRLLVTMPSTRLGGTERHTAGLVARLIAGTGMAVDLAAEPALHAELDALGLGGLHSAALAWETGEDIATRIARQDAETRRLLDALRPDAALVPLPWPNAGTGVLPALAAAGLPRVVLLHLAPEAAAPDIPPTLGLDGAIVAAVSAPVARRAATAWGLPAGGIAILPNPAPAPSELDRMAARTTIRAAMGLAPGAKLLLFVGRLEKAKGADLLPAIAARLDATVAVAGDGPLREMLEAAGMPNLRLLGQIPDPAAWYLAADALLLPSRLEGAPLVFLEAAANRLPVVATAAALEAFEDAGRLACLAATPDAAGIAAAATALLTDREQCMAITGAAARLAAGRDWRGVTEGALGLLRAAMLRGGSTG